MCLRLSSELLRGGFLDVPHRLAATACSLEEGLTRTFLVNAFRFFCEYTPPAPEGKRLHNQMRFSAARFPHAPVDGKNNDKSKGRHQRK